MRSVARSVVHRAAEDPPLTSEVISSRRITSALGDGSRLRSATRHLNACRLCAETYCINPQERRFMLATFDQSSRGESTESRIFTAEETNSDVEARPNEKFNSSARSTRRYGQAVCSERPHDRCPCRLRKNLRCGHTKFRRIHDTVAYHDAVTILLPTTPPHPADDLRDTRDQRRGRQCVQLHPDGIEPQR
jgi:hypothetical protein